MSIVAAQRSDADVDHVITEVIGGHMCSCTGYAGIRAAVRSLWVATGVESIGPGE
jgi:aerobic-type carbon monoxide dehydrogenase small subunit (CoxS/CutS family)